MVGCNLVAGAALMTLVVAMTLGSANLLMAYLVAIILAPCDVTFTLAMQASVPALRSVARTSSGWQTGALWRSKGLGSSSSGLGPAATCSLWHGGCRSSLTAISFFVSALLVSSSLPGPGGRVFMRDLRAATSPTCATPLRCPTSPTSATPRRRTDTGLR